MNIYYCKYKRSYILSFKGYVVRSAFQAIADANKDIIGYEALSRIYIDKSGVQVRPDVFFYSLMKEEYRNILCLINKLHLRSGGFQAIYHLDEFRL